MRWKWLVRTVLVYGASLVMLLFAVGLLARELALPSTAFWDQQIALVWLLFGAGVVAAAGNFARTHFLEREVARLRTNDLLGQFCRSVVVSVNELSGKELRVEELAAHVWQLGDSARSEHLRCVARFKLASRLSSGIIWDKSKGAIGRAWATKGAFSADLTNLQDTFKAGRQAFEGLPSDSRLGMTYDEFAKVKHYAAVAVLPLVTVHEQRLVGCISIDTTQAGGHDRLRATVEDGSAIRNLAVPIGQLLDERGRP